MPRDRRPEFKKQVRIKGRVIGLKKWQDKSAFMYFHNLSREDVKEGIRIGFADRPCLASAKAAARADGLIVKTDSEHYENRQISKNKQLEVYKGDSRLFRSF